MGDLKSKIRYSVHRYINNELTEEGFKEQIKEIMLEFEERIPKTLLYQDIGLIVQERVQKIPNKSDKFEKLWTLLDQVEPQIREALNRWKSSMSR
jgi:FKBP-type peptidyl-prolyl cis-trans isomerase (trigger factor)